MTPELNQIMLVSPEIDANNAKKEVLFTPETMELDAGGLLIAGPSGTGKTSLARRLTALFSIDPERNIKIGELFRALKGQPVLGYSDRPLSLDQMLDDKVKEVIYSGTKKDPFVLEARLTGVILSEMKDTGFAPRNKVIAILLIGDENVRRERVHNREKENNPELTLEMATQYDEEREERDLAQWTVGHPQLKDVSPFDPELKDKKGDNVFDIVIDTTVLTVDEVEAELIKQLKMHNAILENKSDAHIAQFDSNVQ